MNDLLQKPMLAGYPADFLFARLRGKRQHLLAERSDSWERLQTDYRWAYSAMPAAMRKAFAPCFLLVELRSLQMIFRFVAGQNRAQLERISDRSLLDRHLLRAIKLCRAIEDLLDVLGSRFDPLLPGGETIQAIYNRDGQRQVEESLVDAVLQALSVRRQKPEIAGFVADQVDLRNLLTAARCLRWQLQGPVLLEGGGEISQQLREAAAGDFLEEAVQHLAGGSANDVALLETELIGRMTRRIEIAARDPLGRGLVLDYLWRRYLAFRRAGMNYWVGADVGAWETAL